MRDEKWIINFQSCQDETQLSEKDSELLAAAKSTLNQAYAPYSHFHVAAAVRLGDGLILSATNQENASYGLSLCAEQNILSQVGSQFHHTPVEAMAITAKHLDHQIDYPISPCGACRQVIREHEARHQHDIRIILQGTSGQIVVFQSVKDLLPMAFSPKDLHIDI